MAVVEESLTEVEKNIQALLTGLNATKEVAAQAVQTATQAVQTANTAITAMDRTSKDCQDLRVTTEKISSTQDQMVTSILNVELGARLHRLEGSSSAGAARIPGPTGHGATLPNQDIAHEHVLGNGAFHLPRNQFESGPSVRPTILIPTQGLIDMTEISISACLRQPSQSLMAVILKFGKRNVKSISTCFMFPKT